MSLVFNSLAPDTLSHWTVFYSTAAECAATLAGLVMVAVSVNIQRILQYPHLPSRASAAIGGLVMLLLLSLAALTPQPPIAFAIELDLGAVLAWGMHIAAARTLLIGHKAAGRPTLETVLALIVGQANVWPLSIGAALLTLGHESGLFWLVAAVMASLASSVLNAWVLLWKSCARACCDLIESDRRSRFWFSRAFVSENRFPLFGTRSSQPRLGGGLHRRSEPA